MEGFRWIHKVEEYSAQKSYHIFQLAIFFSFNRKDDL